MVENLKVIVMLFLLVDFRMNQLAIIRYQKSRSKNWIRFLWHSINS